MGIAVALLVLGSISTLTAFGGDTWRPGQEPLVRRITRRGWLSLICLAAALLLSVWKERSSDAHSAELARERDAAKRELNAANAKLDLVSTQLTQTRTDLAKQTEVSLVTVLSRDFPVRASELALSFDDRIQPLGDPLKLLASEVPEAYLAVLKATVSLNSLAGADLTIEHSQAPSSPTMRGGGDVEPRATVNGADYEVRQQTSRTAKYRSAAVGYNQLAQQSDIGDVTFELQSPFFRSLHEQELFFKAHPVLKPVGYSSNFSEGPHYVRFNMPRDVRDALVKQWRTMLRAGAVRLYIGDDDALVMSAPITVTKVIENKSSVTIVFNVIEKPRIRVGILFDVLR